MYGYLSATTPLPGVSIASQPQISHRNIAGKFPYQNWTSVAPCDQDSTPNLYSYLNAVKPTPTITSKPQPVKDKQKPGSASNTPTSLVDATNKIETGVVSEKKKLGAFKIDACKKFAETGKHTAPDGKVFESEREYKKYVYENFHCFKHRKDEKLVKGPGELKGLPFDLDTLENCEVLLLDVVGQALVDDLVNCRVFIGACTHDVFLRNCKGCTFTIACKQLRTRGCEGCVLNLYSMTRPVVETSSKLTFRRFNGAYPRLSSHFKRASLEPYTNKWGTIHDFSKDDSTYPEPHYTVEEGWAGPDWVVGVESGIKGLKGEPENPVPKNSSRLGFVNTGLSRTSSVLAPKSKKKQGAAKVQNVFGRAKSFGF